MGRGGVNQSMTREHSFYSPTNSLATNLSVGRSVKSANKISALNLHPSDDTAQHSTARTFYVEAIPGRVVITALLRRRRPALLRIHITDCTRWTVEPTCIDRGKCGRHSFIGRNFRVVNQILQCFKQCRTGQTVVDTLIVIERAVITICCCCRNGRHWKCSRRVHRNR